MIRTSHSDQLVTRTPRVKSGENSFYSPTDDATELGVSVPPVEPERCRDTRRLHHAASFTAPD